MQKQANVGFISLGCPKALVDSERILTQLRSDGYNVVPSYEDAGVVVVNTCGFIDAAVEESLQTIGEALQENGKVVVTGCLGADSERILSRYPDVLAVTGPEAYEAVVGAVHQHLPLERKPDPHIDLVPAQGIKLTPRHYAYMKISEGCNQSCSFCIIPGMRGKLVSRMAGDVMQEAEGLVKAGVKELLVVSQDTGAFGVDKKYRTDFYQGRPLKTRIFELAQALGELGVWVRLHYLYPYPHIDKLLPLMANGKILPYLDVPFQHASLRVLKAMRRPAAAGDTIKRVQSWREICPDVTIRSTFIVGFPGETDAEFEELLDFLREARLDRVGCFEYSPVEGAAANDLAPPVPDEVKHDRWQRLMAMQSEISAERLAQKRGKTIPVIVDEVSEEVIVARSQGDAPEIDGQVFVAPPERQVSIGDMIEVRVTDSDAYDLHAEVAE